MSERVINVLTDPTEQLARRLAERVYIELGCASVPLLQRALATALRGERPSREPQEVREATCACPDPQPINLEVTGCGTCDRPL